LTWYFKICRWRRSHIYISSAIWNANWKANCNVVCGR